MMALVGAVPSEPIASVTDTGVAADAGRGSYSSIVEAAQAAAQASPLVECARHRALASQAELDALAANLEATQAQLEKNRDAALAMIEEGFRDIVAAARAAATAKRALLETELVGTDAVLSEALRTAADVAEVRFGAAFQQPVLR